SLLPARRVALKLWVASTSELDPEALQGLNQGLVLRVFVVALFPDAACLVFAVCNPEDLAEMCGDVGGRQLAVRPFEILDGSLEVSDAIQIPADAIQNERIIGFELECALKKLFGLV